MKEFNFHRPATVKDAAALLAAHPEGKLLAGGQSLLPVLKLEMAAPSDLISLARIPELRGIRSAGGEVTIGAATTHAEVASSEVVRERLPGLAHLAGRIGDAQVRNRGTLGGSLAHADPAADYPAAVLAYGATIVTDRRSIRGEDFFRGLFETALEEGEILTAVRFPEADRAAYAKFPNHASKYALVGVMIAQRQGGVRVAVTGAGPKAFRVPEMERALAARFAPEALDGIAIASDDLNSDRDASAEYRAHLVTVMARRAVAAILG